MPLEQASRVVERYRILEREEWDVRESINTVDSALIAIESMLQQANTDMVSDSCFVGPVIISGPYVARIYHGSLMQRLTYTIMMIE